MSSEVVNFVVGGISYPIFKRDVEKYPGSFFSAAIKKEWHVGEVPVEVSRDGELFKHIYAYIVSGSLSMDVKSSDNGDLLDSVRAEAEFFGLPKLAAACVITDDVTASLDQYRTIRHFIDCASGGSLQVDYPCDVTTPLLKALGTLWAPFCVDGSLYWEPTMEIFQSSTIAKLNVAELVTAATPSPFGRGTETVLDTEVRDSLEISADKLDPACLQEISDGIRNRVKTLCPNTPIQLEPYKLVIYQTGGHFDQHRDTVRGEGHIGTVVVILNSEYTGGELEITHGGRTEVVTGPYNWVAMYGDCLHKINPVKSGTRVSLIYDIYSTGNQLLIEGDEQEDEDDEDDEGIGGFWSRDMWGVLGSVPKARGPDTPAIRAALDGELTKLDSVVICLQHMYPACQAVPGFLKGSDAVLYEVLQDHYDVQVVYCTVCRQGAYDGPHSWDGSGEAVCGSLFTTFDREKRKSNSRTKLVVPSQLNLGEVLDYSPFQDQTGNESQQEATVYVTTGLQVSLKK
jgi:predicted 2-oxoglutarate/Fe(II)-dependent dioxygenase YbiX